MKILLFCYTGRGLRGKFWRFVGEKLFEQLLYRKKKTLIINAFARKKHGNIFRLDMAGKPTVVLCDRDDIQEAFSSEAFCGRPYDDLVRIRELRVQTR